MPMINADDGCPIRVEVEGRDGAPVLMLSNSLGTNLHMWDDQIPEFTNGSPQRPLFDGAVWQGRPVNPRCAQNQENELVRIVDGRHGRPVAGREFARSGREARAVQHQFLYEDKTPWIDRIKFVTEKGLDAWSKRTCSDGSRTAFESVPQRRSNA